MILTLFSDMLLYSFFYAGIFVSFQLMGLLSEGQRSSACRPDNDLDLLCDAVVRHSMAVAHVSSDHHRSLIITNCQRVCLRALVFSLSFF